MSGIDVICCRRMSWRDASSLLEAEMNEKTLRAKLAVARAEVDRRVRCARKAGIPPGMVPAVIGAGMLSCSMSLYEACPCRDSDDCTSPYVVVQLCGEFRDAAVEVSCGTDSQQGGGDAVCRSLVFPLAFPNKDCVVIVERADGTRETRTVEFRYNVCWGIEAEPIRFE
jgi:hypothetical protein